MKLILASQSASRKKALDILGLDYECKPSHIDESKIRHDDPMQLAKQLAEAKALEIAKTEPEAIIIGGDFFVIFQNKIYEKPKDEQEAYDMLKTLSNQEHVMIAGIAVYNSKTKKMLSNVEKCTVKFRELTDHEINDYIKRYPVTHFAGAFEGEGTVRFSEYLNGSYLTAIGSPMSSLVKFLRENNVKV